MSALVDAFRRQLDEKLSGAAMRREYWETMRQYFSGKLSHRELAEHVNGALGRDVSLHNKFILAIYAVTDDWRPKKAPQRQKDKPPIKPPIKPPSISPIKPPPVLQQQVMWKTKRPALGIGPPQIHTSLAGGITDLLMDEDSFVALHNRMLQLALPTAVSAISPDSVILVMHALGAYIKMLMHSCPEASAPDNMPDSRTQALIDPPHKFSTIGTEDDQVEWDSAEDESELYDRIALEQVATARAQAQRRAALESSCGGVRPSKRKRKGQSSVLMKARFSLPDAGARRPEDSSVDSKCAADDAPCETWVSVDSETVPTVKRAKVTDNDTGDVADDSKRNMSAAAAAAAESPTVPSAAQASPPTQQQGATATSDSAKADTTIPMEEDQEGGEAGKAAKGATSDAADGTGENTCNGFEGRVEKGTDCKTDVVVVKNEMSTGDGGDRASGTAGSDGSSAALPQRSVRTLADQSRGSRGVSLAAHARRGKGNLRMVVDRTGHWRRQAPPRPHPPLGKLGAQVLEWNTDALSNGVFPARNAGVGVRGDALDELVRFQNEPVAHESYCIYPHLSMSDLALAARVRRFHWQTIV
eukprot:COSAG01_NODE_1341_length_10644_cov_6.517728_5_plen_586_part_00